MPTDVKTPELFAGAHVPVADAVRRDPRRKVTREYAAAYFYEKLGGAAARLEGVVHDFAALRTSKKISPGLLVKEVNFWLDYPQNMVLEATRIWREQRCAENGLGEAYFRGILRNIKKGAEARRRRRHPGAHE